MKYYSYYIAVGALKKYGYQTFETFDGRCMSLQDLLRRPIVQDAKAPIYVPHADGTVQTKTGLILIKPDKETT